MIVAEENGLNPAEEKPDLNVPTIKETQQDDRPQERAMEHGVTSLSIPDLWALVLRSGLPGKPITLLTRELMRANDGSLHTLERRTRKEILQTKGLGTIKALQIEAVMELIRRYNREIIPDNPIIHHAADLDALMRPRIANLPHEEIWIVTLNRRNQVISITKISAGGTSASVFDLKLVLKRALLENADAMAMCHNHPSGTLRPSPQDDGITRQCADGCKTLGIRFIDHIILTASSYYSYNDNGRL